MQKFAEHYDWILNRKSKTIYALRYLPDKVFWKTILTTAKIREFPGFAKLSEELRRLYFSYWIAGYTTAKTRNFSFKLIKLIKDGKTLAQIKKEINKKIHDDNIIESVEESLEDDVYRETWIKPLLILIEYGQTDASVFIEYSRNLHVDRILPEKWKKKIHWRKKWTEKEATYWLNKMGNLTLLSGRKNIKASNEDFHEKKKIYKGKGLDGTTAFEISKKILKKSDWTEKEINRRQKWLIGQTKRILNLNF